MIFDHLNLFASRSTPAPSAGGGFSIFRPPVAGVNVTADTALTYSAYFACIKIISETIASLSWHAYQRQNGRRSLLVGDPLDMLLYRQPNPEMTPFRFKELALAQALSKGNFYAEVARSRSGTIGELWPIDTDTCQPARDSKGKLVYEIQGSGSKQTLQAEDILHIRNTTQDGIVGLSIASLARETISFGMATEQFGASFFGNGAFPAAVIKNTGQKDLSPEGVKNLLRTFNKKNRGASNANRVEYLSASMDIVPIGIPAKDAQFLESRKFQISEVCRWFRMPPHKLADLERATFSNIEDQNIQFVTDTILPWTYRLETEADFRLLSERPDVYTKININALLRGDMAARAAFYKELFNMGVYSIDEIRELEELDRLENGAGSLRVVPLNMVPVENARDQYNNQNQGNTAAQGVVRDVCRRLARVEIKRAEAMARKGDDEFRADTASFYVRHAEAIVEGLTNPALVLAAVAGVDIEKVDATVRELAGQVAMDSADELQKARAESRVESLLRSWESRKAENLAAALINKITRG